MIANKTCIECQGNVCSCSALQGNQVLYLGAEHMRDIILILAIMFSVLV